MQATRLAPLRVGGAEMRPIGAVLALALCLLGCGSQPSPADRVELVTDSRSGYADASGTFTLLCTLNPSYGELVADPESGVAFRDSGAPAVWPAGSIGRRVGSEVEVVSPAGVVVATTGQGLQQIYFVVLPGTLEPTNTICGASRAAEHLQPSPR